MNCEPVQDRLSAYLDDELTGSEVGEVEGHLRQCRECQRIHRGLQATSRALADAFQNTLQEAPLPRGIPPVAAGRRSSSIRRGWWAAAAALIIAGGLFWWNHSRQEPPAAEVLTYAIHQYRALPGMELRLVEERKADEPADEPVDEPREDESRPNFFTRMVFQPPNRYVQQRNASPSQWLPEEDIRGSDGNTAWRFDPEQEHVVVQPVASQIAGVAAGSGDRTSWERMRFVAWEFIQQIDLTRVDVVDATRAEDAARGRRRLVTRPAGDDNKTWREATLVVDSDDQIESMEVCLGTAWQSVTIYVEVVDRGREYDPEYFVYQRYVSEAVPVVPGPSTLEQLRAFGYITTDEATDSPRLREMGYIDR